MIKFAEHKIKSLWPKKMQKKSEINEHKPFSQEMWARMNVVECLFVLVQMNL